MADVNNSTHELSFSEKAPTNLVDSDEEGFLSDIECDLCSKSFNSVSMYEQHLKGKKHNQKMKLERLKKKLGNGEYHSSEDAEGSCEEQLHCKICDKTISGYIPFQAHISGSTHAKNVRRQKMTELLRDKPGVLHDSGDSDEAGDLLRKPFARCDICEKEFQDPAAYQNHMKGSGHKKRLQKLEAMNSLKDDLADPADDVAFSRCDVCSTCFSGPVPYKIHLQSAVHQKRVRNARAEEELKEFFEKDLESGMLTCKECGKVFPNPTAFRQHLDNNAHEKQKSRDKVFEFVTEHPEIAAVKSVKNLVGESEEEGSDAEKENYRNGDYFLLCKVCHSSFSGPESARDHVASRKHVKAVKEAAEMKKLKRKLKDGAGVSKVHHSGNGEGKKELIGVGTSPQDKTKEAELACSELNEYEVL